MRRKLDSKAYARTIPFRDGKETELEFANILAAGKTVEEAKAKFLSHVSKALSQNGPVMVAVGRYVAIVWYDTHLATWGYQIIHPDNNPVAERLGHVSSGIDWDENTAVERARIHLATLAIAEEPTTELLRQCLRFVKTEAGRREVTEAYQRQIAWRQAKQLGLEGEQALEYVWQTARSIPIPA